MNSAEDAVTSTLRSIHRVAQNERLTAGHIRALAMKLGGVPDDATLEISSDYSLREWKEAYGIRIIHDIKDDT